MDNNVQLSTDESKTAVAAAGGRVQYRDRTAEAQNWAQRAVNVHKNTLFRGAIRTLHVFSGSERLAMSCAGLFCIVQQVQIGW